MLLDVLDQSALATSVRDELGKCYPDAKVAHVKDGGNFPYLSRDQEVNMYVEPHTATHPHKHGQEPHAAPALSAPPSPPSRLSSHPLPHHQQNNQRELPILCVWLGGRTARARIRTASTTPATLSLPVLQMIPCCGVESFSLTLHGVSDSRMCIVTAYCP